METRLNSSSPRAEIESSTGAAPFLVESDRDRPAEAQTIEEAIAHQMKIRLRYLAMALFILSAITAAVAVTHMNNLLAFIVIAPGYLVQAWLFETHRAPGGFGYQVTMVGVSALAWTLITLSLAVAVRRLRRVVRLSSSWP